MTAVTVEELLHGAERRLGLSAARGGSGSKRRMDQARVQSLADRCPEELLPGVPLIIPHPVHSRWLRSPEERNPVLRKILSLRIPAVILSGSRRIPDYFDPLIAQYRIPVMASVHDDFLLESRLRGLLREKIERICFRHGVLLNVFGRGVLIAGDSGIGKTTLGIELAQRGHLWVADDLIEIERKGNRLHGRAHRRSRNRLHVRAAGVTEAGRWIRRRNRTDETALDLVIEPVRKDRPQPGNDSRKKEDCEILDVAVPRLELPVAWGGYLKASRAERAVRSFFDGKEEG